ncbi:MAG: FtsX-like permease family protein [Coriobacteriia bacterium]|nr:FtsX-like permease family protein [Coriobacteriia bacterium]
MISPRWKKIARDLWGHKFRTFLVVISVAVGIFAIGVVMGGRGVLLREFDADFAASNPPSAKFSTTGFDNSIVRQIAARSDVLTAEGRRTVGLRFSPDSIPASTAVGWSSITLNALSSFDSIKIDKIVEEQSSSWPPGVGQVVLEKSALQVQQFSIGQIITVEARDGSRVPLRVVGFVHNINAVPTQFTDTVTGYMSMSSLRLLGEPEVYNRLALSFEPGLSQAAASKIAVDIRDNVLAPAGVKVLSTTVPKPGSHFLGDIFKAVSLLLLALGVLSLALSGFLVVTTVSAVMSQQVRQVGIMKAVGGTARQITGMYMTMVAAYGVLALLVGVPIGLISGKWFIAFAADIMNFRVTDFTFPTYVVVLEIVVGLLVPIVAAIVPVRAGARTSVVKALNATGISPNFGHGIFDRLLGLIRGLPRPVALSLRNTFLRKGRLLLTLTTLVLASAVVMSVLSVRASILKTVDEVASFWSYDSLVVFSSAEPGSALEREAKKIGGVTAVETWLESSVSLKRQDGSEDEGIYGAGIPVNSTFVNPALLSGRWLRAGDDHAVVVNADVIKDQPNLKVGDTITLTMRGAKSDWKIVGIAAGQLRGETIFFSRSALDSALGAGGGVTRLLVKTELHTEQAQQQVAVALETRLEKAGFAASGSETQSTMRATIANQLGILVTFLVIMASLLAIVGVIGLTGTMTINVLESTREIGVMRAIGAAHGSIFGIFITEGVVIGIMSWGLGAILSWPLSIGLVSALGGAMGMHLAYQFSWFGVGLWLVSVVAIAVVASLLPAWNASRVSVRDAISYE